MKTTDTTTEPPATTARSADSTRIAFTRTGQGPPVVLVVGAFNDRGTGAPLAQALAPHFTVFSYDRRGRGDSGDAATYAVERELEDLEAVLGAAGGAASVFGYSSGAVLALRAAIAGLPIPKLIVYDTPPRQPAEHAATVAALIAEGRRGDAVEHFQHRVVGIPEAVVADLRHAPFRPALEAMAHTLVYDCTIIGDGYPTPAALATIRQPTLVLAGGAGASVMRETAAVVARSVTNSRHEVIEGATHDLSPSLLVGVLERFLSGA